MGFTGMDDRFINNRGKILGISLALISGEPLLVLVGLLLGHAFDLYWRAYHQRSFQETLHNELTHAQRYHISQQAFFIATFTTMGHIAKADGRVSQKDIDLASKVMDTLNLSDESRKEAIQLFNAGKSNKHGIDPVLLELKNKCSYPSLLELFIETQIKLAHASGPLSTKKRRLLRHVCEKIGYNLNDFIDCKKQNTAQFHGTDPYKILGVSPSASKTTIKKAYRKLMNENHPDKLKANGLPDDMLALATEKTQAIQKAYQQIKKEKKAESNR